MRIKCTRTIEVPEKDSYNASLLKLDDRYLMAYRPSGHEICTCFLDQDYNMIKDTNMRLPINRNVDPRLILYKDKIFMCTSYRGGKHRIELSELCVRLNRVRIEPDSTIKFDYIYNDPKYRRTDEKNWGMFVHDGELLFVHKIHPHRVLRVDFKEKRAELISKIGWETHGFWKKVGIRGNTNPIPLDENRMLSTFHIQRPHRVYYTGFYIFERKMPFRPLSYTINPWFLPTDATSKPRNMAKVVFPMSMELKGDTLIVCGGDNDTAIRLYYLSLDDILKDMIEVGEAPDEQSEEWKASFSRWSPSFGEKVSGERYLPGPIRFYKPKKRENT